MMCEPDSHSQDSLCPRCERNVLIKPTSRNAISNVDKKTVICIPCGKEEGLINWLVHQDKKEKIDKFSLDVENRFRKKLGEKKIEL